MFKEKLLIIIGLAVIGLVYFYNAEQERLKHVSALQAEIIQRGKPRVIEIYANWCGPCRAFSPIFETVSQKFVDKIDFERHNFDDKQSKNLIYAFNVHSIPTVILLDKHGNKVDQFTGGRSEKDFTDIVLDLAKKP